MAKRGCRRPDLDAPGARGHRPPAQGATREEITALAVTIADREGLDAVSMRRVAANSGPALPRCTATSIPATT